MKNLVAVYMTAFGEKHGREVYDWVMSRDSLETDFDRMDDYAARACRHSEVIERIESEVLSSPDSVRLKKSWREEGCFWTIWIEDHGRDCGSFHGSLEDVLSTGFRA